MGHVTQHKARQVITQCVVQFLLGCIHQNYFFTGCAYVLAELLNLTLHFPKQCTPNTVGTMSLPPDSASNETNWLNDLIKVTQASCVTTSTQEYIYSIETIISNNYERFGFSIILIVHYCTLSFIT